MNKSLKNKMKILELEKPLGDLVSTVDTLTGGKLSRRRKMKAKLIELKDKLGMKDGGKVQKFSGGGETDPKTDLEKQMEALKEIIDADTQGSFAGTDTVTDKDREAMKKFMQNLKSGGKVVPVKMGSGGGVCKGMGIARAGGKFKIR
jgi:hypothetical protein